MAPRGRIRWLRSCGPRPMDSAGVSLALTAWLAWASLASPAAIEAQAEMSAREHFQSGVSAFEAEEFDSALASFRDAYRLQPHPTVLVNIANCYLYLERPVEAASFFRRYLLEAGESASAAQRREIEGALARAQANVARIEVDGPPGVTVFLDGGRVGDTPLDAPISTNPGPHILEFSAPNGGIESHRITLEAGALARVSPTTPAAPSPEPIGADEVQDESPTRPTSTRRVLAWVTAGAAVGAAVTGTVFGLTALSQEQDFNDVVRNLEGLPANNPNSEILRANGRAIDESRRTNALISDLLITTSLISAGVSVYLFLTEPSTEGDEAAETPQLGFFADQDSAMMWIGGEF